MLFHLNEDALPAIDIAPVGREPLALHRSLPDYAPTPLVSVPAGARLGLAELMVKDESHRLGLPSFKVLGASWAIYATLSAYLGKPVGSLSLGDLRGLLALAGPIELLAATDGNHGRAVARVARWLGIGARIFVPHDLPPGRVAAIAAEGAEIVSVDGSYDDAVDAAARAARRASILISDTASAPDEQVPARIADGYSTLFVEIDEAPEASSRPRFDVVFVQAGVGGLAAAAVRHYRRVDSPGPRPRIVVVEPVGAACLLAAARCGQVVAIPITGASAMTCLICGTASQTAWPLVSRGVDAFLAIEDERLGEARAILAEAGVEAGSTGCAGLAGLLAVQADARLSELRSRLGLDRGARALVIATERRAAAGGLDP